METDPAVAAIVRPRSAEVAGLTVVERETRLDGPLREAAERMRQSAERADVTAAVRAMYSRTGVDPTKTRPSSEALLRRVRKGGELPRINSAVDVINWCSLESQLPFGLYDLGRIRGAVVLRLGQPGEHYDGIRKDAVNVAGRLTLADESGPFGNPTSDSARTMVTLDTTAVLVVIFAPASLPERATEQVLALTTSRLEQYVGVRPGSDEGQTT